MPLASSKAQLWPPEVRGFSPSALPHSIAPLSSAETSWEALAAAQSQPGRGKRTSSVMVLFVPGEAETDPAALLFTRRSTAVRSHKGQVSFAGGRFDTGDATPAATALRELDEEVGVPPDKVTVLGLLPPIGALDGGGVYPVVGLADIKLADLVPSAAEVAAVFTAPWTCFTRGQGQSFAFNMFGNWRNSWVFSTPTGNIWGLTALILHSAALA